MNHLKIEPWLVRITEELDYTDFDNFKHIITHTILEYNIVLVHTL